MNLSDALVGFAALPTVLIATDFDGVVAPIVSNPAAAFPLDGTVPALEALSALPGVTVAVVSGRDRATLGRLSGVREPIVTVGSHGAEWAEGLAGVLDSAALARRATVLEQLTAISERYPGSTVESKPLGAALHVRNVTAAAGADAAAEALDLARSGPAALPGVHSTDGKAVLELTVLDASKGRALRVLRERVGAQAVLYLGDDVTDETAFVVLTAPGDVSIKVGDGATAARFRVGGPADARSVFEELLALRRA